MAEDAESWPGRLVPAALRQLLIHLRNRESLLRLALLAIGMGDRVAFGDW